MNRAIVAATLIALGTGSAYAQSPENDEGLYLGLGYGAFNVGIDDVDDADEAIQEIDDDDNAWKVFAGWRLNPYFSFELNYVDFADLSDATGTSGDYQLDIAGVQPAIYGTFPLGPVELFGKLSYYFLDVDLNVDLDDLTDDVITSDSSDEAWSYGFGVGATILERLALKLEYEKIDLDTLDDFDAIWLSGAWRF